MSDEGYESGVIAEARERQALSPDERSTPKSRALGAVVAGTAFAVTFLFACLLWPYLMRFGMLGDRVGTHANGEGNVDWPAVWALMAAVLIAAAIVFALTRALSMRSSGGFWSDIAGALTSSGKGRKPKPETHSRAGGAGVKGPGAHTGST